MKARLILADDHEELLREIKELLCHDYTIVAAVPDGAALLVHAEELHPDLVVTDLKMPHLTGIEAARRLLSQKLCGAVVLLTLYSDPLLVRSAMDAGIRGFVTKDRAGVDLIPAIETVLRGGTFASCAVGS